MNKGIDGKNPDMQRRFKINDFLFLALESGRTNIYVDEIYFSHCKYLLLEVSLEESDIYGPFSSIDEFAEELDRSLEGKAPGTGDITEEVEFWGHCSNLQAWYEHEYDSNLLHSNLAFPLLERLVQAGDPLARRVFKEEVAKRLDSKYPSVVKFIMEGGYLKWFTDEEKETVYRDPDLIEEYMLTYKRTSFISIPNKQKGIYNLTEVEKEVALQNFFAPGAINDELDVISALEGLFGTPFLSFENECTQGKVITLSLRGQDIHTLPSLIGRLVHLKELDVSANNLTEIPSFIGKLKNLRELNLMGNDIKEVPEAIGYLKNLRFLLLDENRIEKITESIGSLKKLKILSIGDNHLTTLPVSMKHLSQLRELDVTRNKITVYPECISSLTSLRELYLGGNPIGMLPESISKLKNLRRLFLTDCQLGMFPSGILSLTKLRSLQLSGNGLYYLPHEIKSLSELRELYLSNNTFFSFPAPLLDIPHLTDLAIGSYISRLPKDIGSHFPILQRLILKSNHLKKLPESFATLPLLVLDLSYNNFEQFPQVICKMRKLFALFFTNNNLCTLPGEITNMPLKALYVDKNHFINPFIGLGINKKEEMRNMSKKQYIQELNDRGINSRTNRALLELYVAGATIDLAPDNEETIFDFWSANS